METSPSATALAVVELARAGRFTELEGRFAPRLRAAASAETVGAGWALEVDRVGPIVTVGEPVTEEGPEGLVRVTVPVTGENGTVSVVMSVDDTGLLHGLRLAPAAPTSWTAPGYAVPKRFTEREITLDASPGTVAGTLTLPKGRGPRPGVVLLSGGGPFDRDETGGPNKPFKDIAWGLASRGVAVLRFDKVTHGREHLLSEPDFTMTDEYVPHAVAAVRALREHADRIFVLGHSMGGKIAPRVAAAEPAVAGLVIMAGDTQPMHHAAVRVARHLIALGIDAPVAELERQAALIDGPDLSPSTPAADLIFGLSGSYWLDVRGYDPVATAVTVERPMLILQGARDYQVTVDDDLAGWRAGLADRPDVTIRVHDRDDHLFFPGTGPSTPADSIAPQHVDPAVVAEIADWLVGDQRVSRTALSWMRRRKSWSWSRSAGVNPA